MADKASSSISSSVFKDKMKAIISGSLNYEPADSSQKWIFTKKSINASANLLGTQKDFLQTGEPLHLSDKYKWVAIKNISSSKTDGIGINLDGGDSTSITDATSMYIAGGEMIILKCQCTIDNLHVGSVTMDGTYGYPSATNGSAVDAHVFAILDDYSA